MGGKQVVDVLESVWRSLDEVCSDLTTGEWDRATDCPGWSVKDNLSHIIGTESAIMGRPAPDHDPGPRPWVRNPIGEGNEVQVDYRRPWPPEKVLEEFREVTGERLKTLRAYSDEDLAAESWTPVGQGTVADLLAIRAMDCWVHEQDIRRSVGKPGSLTGPTAEHAFNRHTSALGFVVGKKVGPPEGTSVVVEVDGFGTRGVTIEGGRGKAVSDVADPTVKLSVDLETFNCLCTGRWDPAKALEDGKVRIEGDRDLGRRVVENMNFMI